MIRLTRKRLVRDRVVLHKHDLPRICNGCGASYATWPQRCAACAGTDFGWACRDCNVGLEDVEVTYSSSSPRGAVAEKVLLADRCPKCHRVHLARSRVDDFDAFVAAAPTGFRILPEHGYTSAKEMEVFAFVYRHEVFVPRVIERRHGGMRLRYADRSRFFGEHAGYFTALDLGDYGLDESPTIRISPPPPYSPVQVASVRVLIAKLQLALDLEVETANDVDDASSLVQSLLSWRRDGDRRALSLASALREGSHPGRVVNVFRLLELVLERLLDAEIGRKRRTTRTVGDRAFIELAATYKADLKTRLRRRVQALATPPRTILAELWQLLRPGHAFDDNAVYEAIASFRNRHVHRPEEGDHGALPWDDPDFERVAVLLMQLVRYLLEHDRGGLNK